MTLKLKWSPRVLGDAQRVYRSQVPFAADALPAILAEIPANANEFMDDAAPAGDLYYRVSVVSGGRESVSAMVTTHSQNAGVVVPPPAPLNTPWVGLRPLNKSFHQGFAINQDDGSFTLVDNSFIAHHGRDFELIANNATPAATAGTSGSATDPTIFNGELVVPWNGQWTFWSTDGQTFLRKFTASHGSTICRGPDPAKLYTFSYGASTRYLEHDPSDGSVTNTVAFSGVSISQIQGSCWSPDHQCWFVTSDADNNVYKVAVNGEVSGPIWVSGRSGNLEGLDYYRGNIYANMDNAGVGTGLYLLKPDGLGEGAASGPISYVGKSAYQAGSGSLTFAPPAGYAENDLFVLVVNSSNQSASDLPAPAGWTLIENPRRGGSSGYRSLIAYKIASASEPSLTIPDYGAGQLGNVFAFRGVNTANPVQASAVLAPATGSQSIYTFPPVASAVTDSMWVGVSLSGADASGGTADVFDHWTAPALRGLNVIEAKVHPYGSGSSYGVACAEIPQAGFDVHHMLCDHFANETYRLSVAFVLNPN